MLIDSYLQSQLTRTPHFLTNRAFQSSSSPPEREVVVVQREFVMVACKNLRPVTFQPTRTSNELLTRVPKTQWLRMIVMIAFAMTAVSFFISDEQRKISSSEAGYAAITKRVKRSIVSRYKAFHPYAVVCAPSTNLTMEHTYALLVPLLVAQDPS